MTTHPADSSAPAADEAEWAAELRAIHAVQLQSEYCRWRRAHGYDPTPEQLALLGRCLMICKAGAGHAPLRKAGVKGDGDDAA